MSILESLNELGLASLTYLTAIFLFIKFAASVLYDKNVKRLARDFSKPARISFYQRSGKTTKRVIELCKAIIGHSVAFGSLIAMSLWGVAFFFSNRTSLQIEQVILLVCLCVGYRMLSKMAYSEAVLAYDRYKRL